MQQQPKQCDLMFAPHNCCLYDCPPDDPEHIHVCFAGDFDFSEGDVVKLKLGLITLEEFDDNGRRRAWQRHDDPDQPDTAELHQRSLQAAKINRSKRGLAIEEK